MKLNKLLKKLSIEIKDIKNHQIKGISTDSRKAKEGDIFFSLTNNIDYIEEALKKNVATIFISKEIKKIIRNDTNIIIVEDTKKYLDLSLKIINEKILKRLKIIGVTGTNGKTTTTTLLYKYLRFINVKATLIGTNGVFISDLEKINSLNTTPGIVELYDIFIKSYQNKVKIIIMEISSHAIKQNRIRYIDFFATLLTNITIDHLDYHKNFTDYKYTKALFITKGKNHIYLNKDISEYEFIANLSSANFETYGFNHSDYQIYNCSIKDDYTTFSIKHSDTTLTIKTNLLGLYNVYNITAFVCLACSLKKLDNRIEYFLAHDIYIDGRMEKIVKDERIFIIDYAHTPDGIERILTFLKEIKKASLITVVGCGGSRDKSKRKLVGSIATELSDYVIFTTDNPREENPITILKQITNKITSNNFTTIVAREEAIKKAYEISKPNDIIALLGKGNEPYIEIKGIKYDYSDKKIVEELGNI